ncbi:MAG TPA: NYN domain-containing protein [Longimicrobiales bacterium]|nr:NYN domain-containing protein [Longimicrobiales bacterium]
MTAQFARTPYRGRSGGSTTAEPHAALLIDFDNVTMGIRSDLTKELKNLLNSDIIKGKVAVQRAYADWRRYPQYIVPLAESSVDLIFAPAYGSAKKNATDIRLAIDAIELVFTRPEIGTIILLSGDSDFSSLVLKLKEYGKYVIGVGIRESASDLLVQNCDEYYSYSALTGLTRAGEEAPVVSEDPWELVELALKQMIDNDDVMRSDRLKQVLLEMDPGFDEKSLGFQKFNKFLQEAATRGLLSLRKQENGQFEVGPPTEGGAEPVETAAEARESRRGRGRRGRGRRDDRPREERKDQLELTERAGGSAGEGAAGEAEAAAETAAAAPAEAAAPAPAASAPQAEAAIAPEAQAEAASEEKPRRAPRKPRETTEAAAEEAAPAPAAERAAPRDRTVSGDRSEKGTGDLAASYDLLRRATSDLVRKNGPAVRDSDVKRRMLELEAGWDESAHGFSKFSRFLRQAHDAEVVSLRQLEGGNYDVLLGAGDGAAEEPRDARGGRRDRGRGRVRPDRPEPAAGESAPRTSQVSEPPAAREPAAAAQAGGATQATEAAPKKDTAAAAAQAAAAQAAPQKPAATQAAAVGFRRGSRGRAAPSGPPPLLEGQTASVKSPVKSVPVEQTPAAESKQEEAAQPASRARKAPAKKAPAKRAAKAPAGQQTREKPAAKKAAVTPGKGGRTSIEGLGLPTDTGEIATYLTAYKGVGPKSVQSLIEAFGAARVFDALETKPDAVRDLLGARAETLLEAWADDIAFRRANAPGGASSARAEGSAAAAKQSRSRRGGRRGGRRGQPAGK